MVASLITEEKKPTARALYMRAWRAGANTHGIFTGQGASYYADYRKRRAAQGRPLKKTTDDIEAPGLKKALSADYRTCGFPEPPLDQFAQEVKDACRNNFWGKHPERGRPTEEPIGWASWDWEWIDKVNAGEL